MCYLNGRNEECSDRSHDAYLSRDLSEGTMVHMSASNWLGDLANTNNILSFWLHSV